MSDTCLTCGGLIMEPGQLYSYAGKICYCPREVKVCRPASQEQRKLHVVPPYIQEILNKLDAILEKLTHV